MTIDFARYSELSAFAVLFYCFVNDAFQLLNLLQFWPCEYFLVYNGL